MNIEVKKQFEYPHKDIEHYIKEYIDNFNAVTYDKSEDIQTIKEEHNDKNVYVFDTFTTTQEQSALASAIYLLGEKIDNTYDDEWIDDEKPEYEETMKHLCRLYGRYSDRQGRKL
jgi:hypothetical protein